MKANIMKIAVFSLVIVGMASCAHPNAKDIDSKDIDSRELSFENDSTELVKSNPESMMARADSLEGYTAYASEIDARFNQNSEALNRMINNSKSEINAVQMEHDQELYELNKRNLEIKNKVKDHDNQGSGSWEDFKESVNNEMNELEKSIKELAEEDS